MQLSFHKDKDEKRFVRALKSGKPDAQRRLYDMLSGKMMAICLRYSRSQEEAEDVMQDGFVRVFRKIGTFNGDGSLEGWVRKVITNVAIRQYQKNSRLHVVVGLEDVEYELGEEILDQAIAEQALLEMIQSLPDGYRLVFNMFAIEGFSHEEIARELGITIGTSKSQLARARQSLRKMLERQQLQISSRIING
jgi:RNA polymerase sigma-70 factor (ECF subfamily)